MIHKPSDYTKLSHLAIFFNSKFSLLKLISKLKHPHYEDVPRKAGTLRTLTVKLYFCKSCLWTLYKATIFLIRFLSPCYFLLIGSGGVWDTCDLIIIIATNQLSLCLNIQGKKSSPILSNQKNTFNDKIYQWRHYHWD